MKSQSDRISHSFQSTLLRYLRTSARKMSIGVQLAGTIGVLGVVGSVSFGQAASAQTAITSISTTSSNQTQEDYSTTTANPCDNGATKVFTCDATAKIIFGSGINDNLNLDSVTAGGTTFSYRGLADKIQIKRLTNPQVSTDRQIMFFQNNSATNATTTAPITPITFNVAPSRVDTMESVLLSNTINRGADNVFANDAPSGNKSKNFNNIERIDYIITNGISAPTALDAADIGFVVMDRGANDRYAIAPILSLDAAGNPMTVGDVQVFNISNSPIANIAQQDYLVVRREDAKVTSLLRPSDRSGNQPIGGHFVSLSKLFSSSAYVPSTKVYGYVLMAPDAPTTSADVVNLTKFPTNSEAGNTTGGIDLIAGGGIFSKNPLPIVTSGASVSGTIFNDVSGNKLQEGTEPIVNGTTLALNAVLFDIASNKVYAVSAVSATGTYSFENVAPGNYTVILTTAAASVSGPMPTVTLPANWTTTGENLNGTVEATPATPDSKIAVTVAAANITNLNFGIEQLPNAIGATAASQPNPTGTTSVAVPITLFNTSTDPDAGTVDKYRITVFPTNATSITIDGVVYTVTAQPGTTAFPALGVTVDKAKLNTITVDPSDGAVTVDISFKAIDNAGKESSNTGSAKLPFTQPTYGISGTVLDDASGNKLREGNERSVDGITLGLNAVLVDSNNKVVGIAPVSTAGNYDFGKYIPGNYTILLTTTATTLNASPPAITLPTNWVTTGENILGIVDAAPDSRISIAVVAADLTINEFGIEQLPTAIGRIAQIQPDPGGTNVVSVPINLFDTSTDPDGIVEKYRITSFPANVTSIEINGVIYTATAQAGTTAFPVGGVTVDRAKLNTIKVDPLNGPINVSIPFTAIDNAGKESTNTANAIVPFGVSQVSISGTVFDDSNGDRVQNGTETSVTGAALSLQVVLVSSGNLVLAVVPISNTGTYTFSGVAPGNYTVFVTANGPSGSFNPPPITLPFNWVTTGENLNGVVDNMPDSKQSIVVGSTAITANFGLEQLPIANGATATPQPNPRNAISVSVPPALFNTSTDADGTVDQYRIINFPSNATSITIDGILYTLGGNPGTTAFPFGGVTVSATKLNTIKVDPNIEGAVDVRIPFVAIDNAGRESTITAEAIVPFTAGNTPELILLKRITKINGLTTGKTTTGAPIDLTQVVANPANPASQSADASNPNWPTVNYPQGAIDAGAIKSGDTIEYTIYFLSNGKAPVTNANFCDWVPKNTTFVPDAYGLGRGIQLAIGSLLNTFTNVPDSDRGVFYNPGATPPATYPNANTFKLNCMSPAGTEGAVVVNLVNNTLPAPENQLPNATAAGTPGNSYGFVRFVSKVR